MVTGKYLGTCAVAVFLTGCGSDEAGSGTATVEVKTPTQAPQPQAQPVGKATKLKALWNQGAIAKKYGNYEGARKAWQSALAIDPGHPGFQEAIDKLPKAGKRGKMIGMTFDSPPDLQPGDEVETTTAIRRYDIVCWERVGKHKLIMRSLSPQESAIYKGRKFQVDKGDEPGALKYIEVK